jgi:hypothetical protein
VLIPRSSHTGNQVILQARAALDGSQAEVLLMSMEKYFTFLPEEQKGVFTDRLGLKAS